MPAVQETVARVKEIDVDKYKYGFFTDIESVKAPKGLSEVDPELLEYYEKLGIPLTEQKLLAGVKESRVAVDAVFDSVSVVTTFKEELAKAGVIFSSVSEAVKTHPELVRKYLGSVVPITDNFYATLNSAVFS